MKKNHFPTIKEPQLLADELASNLNNLVFIWEAAAEHHRYIHDNRGRFLKLIDRISNKLCRGNEYSCMTISPHAGINNSFLHCAEELEETLRENGLIRNRKS